jgi:ATP synthase F1 complex assembly factor 2
MKRFYTTAAPTKNNDGSWCITLDQKHVRTPVGHILSTLHAELASLIAAEWAHQGTILRPETLPLTRFLGTYLDQLQTRSQDLEKILSFVDTDLICYHTEHPQEIAKAQHEHWSPWMHWFQDLSGRKMKITTQLHKIAQDPDIHKFFREYLSKMDSEHVFIVRQIVERTGSPVLALAYAQGLMNVTQLYHLIRIEEWTKADIYGDTSPHEAELIGDLTALGIYVRILSQNHARG